MKFAQEHKIHESRYSIKRKIIISKKKPLLDNSQLHSSTSNSIIQKQITHSNILTLLFFEKKRSNAIDRSIPSPPPIIYKPAKFFFLFQPPSFPFLPPPSIKTRKVYKDRARRHEEGRGRKGGGEGPRFAFTKSGARWKRGRVRGRGIL